MNALPGILVKARYLEIMTRYRICLRFDRSHHDQLLFDMRR